jgi:hypothetical protein
MLKLSLTYIFHRLFIYARPKMKINLFKEDDH